MNQLDVIKTMAALLGMDDSKFIDDSKAIKVQAYDILQKTLRMLNKDITETLALASGIIV